MGCGSQTGCLGPKPRQREVYLDLIDTIYRESLKMQIPINQDPYSFVKAILNKKGWLRKLIDNLISHKSNLYECANQILEISARAVSLSQQTTCLVVVDKIIEEFYKDQEQSQSKQKQMKKSITAQILPAILAMTLPTYNQVPVDMMQRMNVVYFKIIIVLMEKEKIILTDVLRSLSNFLSLKNDKLICKVQIFRLFELLFQNIKDKLHLYENASIFGQLLSRIKENLCNELNKDYITYFVKQWFFKFEKYQPEVGETYMKIIKEYLNNSSGNTEYIVFTLISMLDQVYFNKTEADRIEKLILLSFQNQDSSKYLIRSMAVELIKYLQATEEDHSHFCLRFQNLQDQKSKLNIFKLITKWILENYLSVDTTIQYNPSSIINFYVDNQLTKNSEVAREEFFHEYFKIIEKIGPESVVILTNLLHELIKEKSITKKKREGLFTLLKQIIKIKGDVLKDENYGVKSSFILGIERHYSKQLKIELLNFAMKNIKNLNLLKIKTNSVLCEFFREKMCEFFYSIVDVVITIFENNDSSSEKILDYSQDSVNRMNRLSFLNKFIREVNQTFKLFNDNHLQIYILCFVENINLLLKDLNPVDEQQAILLFFLTFLIQSSLYFMNKKQRVSDLINKMSMKLEKQTLNLQLRVQIIETARNMLINEEDGAVHTQEMLENTKISAIIQKNSKKIKATKDLFMIKEFEWKQVENTFRQCFGGTHRESRKRLNSEVFAQKDFNRMNSLNFSFNQTENEKGSTRNEAEDSFRDIMDRIRHQ